jgi:hypothetical protein
MKRIVLSAAAGGLLVVSPLLAAGTAFAAGNASAIAGSKITHVSSHSAHRSHHATHSTSGGSAVTCSTSQSLQLELACLGSLAVPVAVNALNHLDVLNNFLNNTMVVL